MKNIRIIFMGTSYFSQKILKILIENQANLELVVAQSDKPSGRKKQIISSPVKKYCLKNKLKLDQPENLDEKFLRKIDKINPDVIVVASYGLIIPKIFFQKNSLEFLNIHPSLLPKLRGASPIQTALLNNLKKTGVTLMKMNAGIDSGDIIFQKEIGVNSNYKYPQLEQKILKEIQEFLPKKLVDYLEEKITPKPQDHSNATFSRTIKKQDGKIDWESSAQEIYNKFRAFYQWPQVYTFWKTKKSERKIILTEIEISNDNTENKKAGQVYEKDNKIQMQTKNGSLILKKIKIAGKKEILIEDFINGYPNFINSILR